jgi:hypothetical protein
MTDQHYLDGVSDGAEAERDRISDLLKDYKDGLYDDAKYAEDPALQIARVEAVQYCLSILGRIRL